MQRENQPERGPVSGALYAAVKSPGILHRHRQGLSARSKAYLPEASGPGATLALSKSSDNTGGVNNMIGKVLAGIATAGVLAGVLATGAMAAPAATGTAGPAKGQRGGRGGFGGTGAGS